MSQNMSSAIKLEKYSDRAQMFGECCIQIRVQSQLLQNTKAVRKQKKNRKR